MNAGTVGADFLNVLSEAGWSPSRQLDTRAAEATWREHGHTPSAAAVDFVGRFDSISFRYPQSEVVGGYHACELNAVAATRAVFDSVVRGYERRISEPLCPVGFAASRNLILFVAPSGRVFGGYDQFLALYGETDFEALSRIHGRLPGSPID